MMHSKLGIFSEPKMLRFNIKFLSNGGHCERVYSREAKMFITDQPSPIYTRGLISHMLMITAAISHIGIYRSDQRQLDIAICAPDTLSFGHDQKMDVDETAKRQHRTPNGLENRFIWRLDQRFSGSPPPSYHSRNQSERDEDVWSSEGPKTV